MKYIDQAGGIVAGGWHPAARDQYFRVAHVGAVSAGDIIATLSAIEAGLIRAASLNKVPVWQLRNRYWSRLSKMQVGLLAPTSSGPAVSAPQEEAGMLFRPR